ncbi:MAG: VOC family protein [Verrucomicrobiota bacterium]|nr:VOC family protein [Verrucomicrobiota bacterium]
MRLFDHIDLRVRDGATAKKFYRALLPAIGFTENAGDDDEWWFTAPGEGTQPFFGFIVDPQHRPNENRNAFWAESRAAVDRIAAIAREAGALRIEGPQIWPEYSAGYYALFFEDPEGNRLEVCCRGSLPVAK